MLTQSATMASQMAHEMAKVSATNAPSGLDIMTLPECSTSPRLERTPRMVSGTAAERSVRSADGDMGTAYPRT